MNNSAHAVIKQSAYKTKSREDYLEKEERDETARGDREGG